MANFKLYHIHTSAEEKGQNIWDGITIGGGINEKTGETTASSLISRQRSDFIPIEAATVYTIKADSLGSDFDKQFFLYCYLYFYDKNKQYIEDSRKFTSTFATPKDAKYMIIDFRGEYFYTRFGYNYNKVGLYKIKNQISRELISDFETLKNGLCYTYNETFSIHQNAQKELVFNMDRKLFINNEWIINPFVKTIHNGSILELQDKDDNTHLFIVKNIDLSFKNLNITYKYTCKDMFSYQNSKQQDGYQISNNIEDDDFIGAKTIDWWVTRKIKPECYINYEYCNINKGLYLTTDEFPTIKEFTDADRGSITIGKIIKDPYSSIDENGDDSLQTQLIFSCSNSSANAALISLGAELGLMLHVFECFNGVEYLKYFWFEPKQNPQVSGLKYSPDISVNNFGLSLSSESLTTVLNVEATESGDEYITMLPTVPAFFANWFSSKEWENTQYYKGMFSDYLSGKIFNFTGSLNKIEILSKYDSFTLNKDNEFSIFYDVDNNIYSSKTHKIILNLQTDNAEYSYAENELISKDLAGKMASVTFTCDGKQLIARNCILNFYRKSSDEEIEFARIADATPWLENKLIDFSYFLKQNIITEEEYSNLINTLVNDLRIVNGKLLYLNLSYYQSVKDKTKLLAEITNKLDALSAQFNSEVVEPLRLGEKITDISNYTASYDSIFKSKSNITTTLVDYTNTYDQYLNKHYDAQQRFLKNIYNFSKYFNDYCNLSFNKIYNYTITSTDNQNALSTPTYIKLIDKEENDFKYQIEHNNLPVFVDANYSPTNPIIKNKKSQYDKKIYAATYTAESYVPCKERGFDKYNNSYRYFTKANNIYNPITENELKDKLIKAYIAKGNDLYTHDTKIYTPLSEIRAADQIKTTGTNGYICANDITTTLRWSCMIKPEDTEYPNTAPQYDVDTIPYTNLNNQTITYPWRLSTDNKLAATAEYQNYLWNYYKFNIPVENLYKYDYKLKIVLSQVYDTDKKLKLEPHANIKLTIDGSEKTYIEVPFAKGYFSTKTTTYDSTLSTPGYSVTSQPLAYYTPIIASSDYFQTIGDMCNLDDSGFKSINLYGAKPTNTIYQYITKKALSAAPSLTDTSFKEDKVILYNAYDVSDNSLLDSTKSNFFADPDDWYNSLKTTCYFLKTAKTQLTDASGGKYKADYPPVFDELMKHFTVLTDGNTTYEIDGAAKDIIRTMPYNNYTCYDRFFVHTYSNNITYKVNNETHNENYHVKDKKFEFYESVEELDDLSDITLYLIPLSKCIYKNKYTQTNSMYAYKNPFGSREISAIKWYPLEQNAIKISPKDLEQYKNYAAKYKIYNAAHRVLTPTGKWNNGELRRQAPYIFSFEAADISELKDLYMIARIADSSETKVTSSTVDISKQLYDKHGAKFDPLNQISLSLINDLYCTFEEDRGYELYSSDKDISDQTHYYEKTSSNEYKRLYTIKQMSDAGSFRYIGSTSAHIITFEPQTEFELDTYSFDTQNEKITITHNGKRIIKDGDKDYDNNTYITIKCETIDTPTLTNGAFWCAYHTSDSIPTLFAAAASIETQLQTYWDQAYTASKYCDYFLPEYWQNRDGKSINAYSHDIYAYDAATATATLKNIYIPDVYICAKNMNKYYWRTTTSMEEDVGLIADELIEQDDDQQINAATLPDITNNNSLKDFFLSTNKDYYVTKIGKTTYYHSSDGGTKWKDLAFNNCGSGYCENFGGLYEMTYKLIDRMTTKETNTSYKDRLKEKQEIWRQIHNDYPFLLLEDSYSYENATTSTEIFNMAKFIFKGKKQPQQKYNVGVIDIGSLKGYRGQELKIGRGILLDVNDYYDDIDDIYNSINQYLFISDISYSLRSDANIQITVNNIKYEEKLLQSLVKLIR